MPSVHQLTALAAFLPLSLALPTSTLASPKLNGFSVSQVLNPNFSTRNGRAAMAKAMNKYGVAPINLLQDTSSQSTPTSAGKVQGKVAVAQPGDADTTAIDSSDLEYLTPVIVGGKQYLLDFDTGSSNLWIGGQGTSAKNKYVPSGKAIAGPAWNIAYGDGTTASGDVYSETVVVGETTATAVAVGRATSAPDSIFLPGSNNAPGADGLLGLAFSYNNTFQPQQKTWFDDAVAQGLAPVFGVNLMPGTVAGSYDFGQLNSASYGGPITYANTDTTNGYWAVHPTSGDYGVMDTGTTLILLATNTVKAYYSQAASVAAGAHYDSIGQQWVFNCNSTLPDFSVEFGTHKATVPGSFLNYSVLGNGLCYPAIQDRGAINVSIYGDRFLMTQYVIFDQRSGTPQIGFAAKAGAS